jgi:hypothetical protein
MSGKRRLRSPIAYCTSDRIVVRGNELADLIGRVPLGTSLRGAEESRVDAEASKHLRNGTDPSSAGSPGSD